MKTLQRHESLAESSWERRMRWNAFESRSVEHSRLNPVTAVNGNELQYEYCKQSGTTKHRL